MPTAYLMIGAPCSGKSTYYNTVLKPKGVKLLSSDAVLERIAKEKGFEYNEAFATAMEHANYVFLEELKDAIENYRGDICLDRTHCFRKGREKMVRYLTEYGYNVVGVYFSARNFPFSLLKENNIKRHKEDKKFIPTGVILTFYEGLRVEPPTIKEGFSEIIEVEPFVGKE